MCYRAFPFDVFYGLLQMGRFYDIVVITITGTFPSPIARVPMGAGWDSRRRVQDRDGGEQQSRFLQTFQA